MTTPSPKVVMTPEHAYAVLTEAEKIVRASHAYNSALGGPKPSSAEEAVADDLRKLILGRCFDGAHLAPRPVSDEDASGKATEWLQKQADLCNLHGLNVERDHYLAAIAALVSDRQRHASLDGGRVPDAMTVQQAAYKYRSSDGWEHIGYVAGWNTYREALLSQRGQSREDDAKDAARYRWLKRGGKSKDELLAFVLQKDPDAAIDKAILTAAPRPGDEGKGNG